jgi:peptide/nickel transport system permease protein
MHPILKLVLQRLALGCLLLVAASALIFAGTMILPGDVAQSILGQSATPQALANLRAELGLDVPPVQRYFDWLGGVLHGDLGTSLTNRLDIADTMGKRLGNTLFLAFWAAIISVPLAIFLGLLAVRYEGRWPDKLISGVTLASISIPEFLIGYVLIYFIAVKLRLFTTVAMINDGMSLGEKLTAIALPVIVLTLVVLAHMMRMTRAAIINLLASPYIEMARLKGLSPFRVIVVHALPNALAPIINVVALNLAYLITGVVVVEVVFVYPGIGQLFVDSVKIRDIPVVQACCMVFASAYILLNLLADIMAILSNPRLRIPK